MNLIERAKGICLSPASEWTTIRGEPAEAPALVAGYVLPLAGLAAAAQLVGETVIGRNYGLLGTFRLPIGTALTAAVASLVFTAIGVLLMSFVIDALAPTFGAEKSREQALKLAVYSATPAWIAGVLQIVPALGVFALLGGFYALYVLYLGLPRLMKCPPEKAVPYIATVLVCALAMGVVASFLTARIGTVDVAASMVR